MTPDRPTGPATAEARVLIALLREARILWPNDLTQVALPVIEDHVVGIEAAVKARILAALPEALRQTMKDDSFDEWRLRFDGSHDELAAALAAVIEKVVG